MFIATPSGLVWTSSSRPCSAARRSRKAIISLNFHVVSTCSSGKGGFDGIEGLHGEMQHHRRILADRIEHHRPLAFGDDLAHDVDALRLEPIEMAERLGRQRVHRESSGAAPRVRRPSGPTCRPHSFFSSSSHHQRPARSLSPGSQRARAGRAADGEKALGVQLVHRHAELLRRGDDGLARVIGERIELDEPALGVELDEIHALARLRLIGAQARHPGGGAGEQARRAAPPCAHGSSPCDSRPSDRSR